MIVEKNRPKK